MHNHGLARALCFSAWPETRAQRGSPLTRFRQDEREAVGRVGLELVGIEVSSSLASINCFLRSQNSFTESSNGTRSVALCAERIYVWVCVAVVARLLHLRSEAVRSLVLPLWIEHMIRACDQPVAGSGESTAKGADRQILQEPW
jgi:hypothetical protein